ADPARFRAVRAAVGDSSLLSASASAGAAAGSHSVEVTQLAKAQKLASVALPTTADPLGTGQITIEFGSYSGGAFTLNPDQTGKPTGTGAARRSLAGVRDAINAAGGDVTASLVNDGTGQRLVLASTLTGAASAMRVTVTDGDGNNTDAAGLSRLAYDASAG